MFYDADEAEVKLNSKDAAIVRFSVKKGQRNSPRYSRFTGILGFN